MREGSSICHQNGVHFWGCGGTRAGGCGDERAKTGTGCDCEGVVWRGDSNGQYSGEYSSTAGGDQ